MDDGGFEDTPPIRVHAVVSVDDGTLVVDLTGSSAQVPSGMNVPIASTHAGTYFAVRAFLGPTVPQNAGLTSRVRVIAPEGSLFNPTFPAALSARHLAVQRLTDVLIEGARASCCRSARSPPARCRSRRWSSRPSTPARAG